jgi:hypothetical protein
MSSHSLIGANRNTHLKITAVALVGAILLVVVGMIARTDNSETVTAQVHDPVLNVGKPMTVTTRDASTIR